MQLSKKLQYKTLPIIMFDNDWTIWKVKLINFLTSQRQGFNETWTCQ